MPQLSEEQFLQRLGVNQLTPEDAAARLNQAEMSAERQIALQESAQRAAQDQASTLGGRLQIPGLTFQGNLEQRMAGGEQTLRSIAEKFIDNPEGQNAQRIEQIGAEGQFNRMLLAELQDASPKLSFTGDALTFAFEAAITGPQARGGLLAKSLQEAAIGGLFGATVPTATEGEKAAAVATGVLTGAVSPSIFAGVGRGLAMSREAQQNVLQHVRMMKQLNQSGLLTLGELTGRSSFRKIEAALDNIPFFGMAGFRDQQRARFRDMADTLVGRITGGVRGDVDDLAKKLASRYDKNQGIVEKMYDSIARRLDTPAAPRVDFKNMRAVAQELLGEERGLPQFIQDPRLKKSLSQILSDDRSFTFNAARKTLSRMKADVRGQFDNMGRQQSREVRASLVKLQSAMINDMDNFMNQVSPTGALKRDFEAANDAFKRLILPFYGAEVVEQAGRGRLNMLDMDELVGAFFNPSKPIRSQEMLGTLAVDEKRLVNYLVLRESLSAANHGGVHMNPQTFANELSRNSKLWGAVLSGEQKELLEGFITLTRQANRAFRRVDSIGSMVGGGAVGAAVTGAASVGGAAAGAGVLGTIVGARFLLTTEAGRAFARAGAEAQNSQAAMAVMRKAEQAATRWLESETSKAVTMQQVENLGQSFGIR